MGIFLTIDGRSSRHFAASPPGSTSDANHMKLTSRRPIQPIRIMAEKINLAHRRLMRGLYDSRQDFLQSRQHLLQQFQGLLPPRQQEILSRQGLLQRLQGLLPPRP
jgi:hypothetical protein